MQGLAACEIVGTESISSGPVLRPLVRWPRRVSRHGLADGSRAAWPTMAAQHTHSLNWIEIFKFWACHVNYEALARTYVRVRTIPDLGVESGPELLDDHAWAP